MIGRDTPRRDVKPLDASIATITVNGAVTDDRLEDARVDCVCCGVGDTCNHSNARERETSSVEHESGQMKQQCV